MYPELGALLLRVVLGFTFFLHGLSKFQGGIGNTSGFFESMGIPGFIAYIVASIELVGGIAVIAGIGTRMISLLFVVIMAGALFVVNLSEGFLGGYELDLILLVIALYFVLNGSSWFSLDSKLSISKNQDINNSIN
ncbi:DoxX family protein [Metabacillus sediminilitoris]|uniref:DoxX family protein n=2 Tax=Metabacillus sediminilitoris TaxID=2567941 RepID=A0A4S4BYF2_9BACI|nr:DoxX family membrane protein [Metabacillus sediminilitoris]THF80256.1 DoxX family protein [Metabacillus sediminilitoris]